MKSLLKRHLPVGIWQMLRSLNHGVAKGVRNTFEASGLVVARKRDYHSPLPSERQLRKTRARWAKPSPLRGITFDLPAMKTRLQGLTKSYFEEFGRLSSHASLSQEGYGHGYPQVDAFTLYAMLRQLRPARYIEVGSGLSTYYAHLARVKNREQGCDMRMVCVEPYPFTKLRAVEPIELIQSEVQDVPIERFRSLAAGDVLFIDSSHVVRIDGDVPYLFLEVLPVIAPGVYVHVHDVHLPYNIPYPPDYWTLPDHPQSLHWPMYWTEGMLLQAFLAFNRSFEIVLSCPLILHSDEPFLRATLPIYQPVTQQPNTFSSLWLRRVD